MNKDHGHWIAYTPAAIPVNAPPNAMFCRRDSDGIDWYEYVHPGTNFANDTVKFATRWDDVLQAYIVGPVTYDATAIFPAGHRVYEMPDYNGEDPQTEFGNKLYDPETEKFTDLPPPPTRADNQVLQALAAIQNRLDALEKK